MESIVVAVLVGCFVLVMAPAAFVMLIDADAIDRDAPVAPTPLAPARGCESHELEDRIAA